MSFADLAKAAAAATKGGTGLGDLAETLKDDYQQYADAMAESQFMMALALLDYLAGRESELFGLAWTGGTAAAAVVKEFLDSVEEEKAFVTKKMSPEPDPTQGGAAAQAAAAPAFPELSRFDEDDAAAMSAKAKFTTYLGNCLSAGLPRADVVAAAVNVIDTAGGWKSRFGFDALVNVFRKRLAGRTEHATDTVLDACCTLDPDAGLLAELRAGMPAVEEEEQVEAAPFVLQDKDGFLADLSKQIQADRKLVNKIWDTSPPFRQRLIHSLMHVPAGLARLSAVDYLVEAIDPKHRTVSGSLIESWARANTGMDVVAWLDTQEIGPGTQQGGYSTEYMTSERREEYRLEFTPPAISMQDGNPLKDDSIFVLSADGTFYGGAKKKGGDASVHHTSFMAGAAVKGAGHFTTTASGVLVGVDERSGHYAPGKEQFTQVLLALKANGMNLAKITAHIGGAWNAQEWLDKALSPKAEELVTTGTNS